MSNPPKRRQAATGSGRTTPKGSGRVTAKGGAKATTPAASSTSGRYTPPGPRPRGHSPVWVPILMFVLVGLGALAIILNYLGVLPGAESNLYLLAGLALILGGIITATNWH